MPKITQGFALVLIVMGVSGYLLTDRVSPTALIPTFIGIPVLLCGWLAARPNARRALWMHVAVVLMALGFLGTLRAVPGLITWLGGGAVASGAALLAQLLMLVVCLAYVLLAVRSFINARRRPHKATTAAPGESGRSPS